MTEQLRLMHAFLRGVARPLDVNGDVAATTVSGRWMVAAVDRTGLAAVLVGQGPEQVNPMCLVQIGEHRRLPQPPGDGVGSMWGLDLEAPSWGDVGVPTTSGVPGLTPWVPAAPAGTGGGPRVVVATGQGDHVHGFHNVAALDEALAVTDPSLLEQAARTIGALVPVTVQDETNVDVDELEERVRAAEERATEAERKARRRKDQVRNLSAMLNDARAGLARPQEAVVAVSPDEPGEADDDVITPAPLPRVPDEARESMAAALEWARTLPGVHVEAGADGLDTLSQNVREGLWASRAADAYALMSGYAASREAGWRGSMRTYSQVSSSPIHEARIAMSESSDTTCSRWGRERVRAACDAVGEGGTATFWPHVKLDHKDPAPRIHFLIAPDGSVHVGYVGRHLTTISTARV